jgi:hypothetical protein
MAESNIEVLGRQILAATERAAAQSADAWRLAIQNVMSPEVARMQEAARDAEALRQSAVAEHAALTRTRDQLQPARFSPA